MGESKDPSTCVSWSVCPLGEQWQYWRLHPLGTFDLHQVGAWGGTLSPQRPMFNVACEGSHMKDFGGVVLVHETTLDLPPFKGVVPSQHSSVLGLGHYCGLTVH